MTFLSGRYYRILKKSVRYLANEKQGTRWRQLILSHTELTNDHLTPELKLNLITPNCPLWNSQGDSGPFKDPFWAFYWPGGQVLTRYILDNPGHFRSKRILDVGSGCGASAIACSLVGAASVLANDIDDVALEALTLNAEENNVQVDLCNQNLIGEKGPWDIILLGDMFYDESFAKSVTTWIQTLRSEVYVGDPGRLPFSTSLIKEFFANVAEYDLPENCLKENSGQSSGYVWYYNGDNAQ